MWFRWRSIRRINVQFHVSQSQTRQRSHSRRGKVSAEEFHYEKIYWKWKVSTHLRLIKVEDIAIEMLHFSHTVDNRLDHLIRQQVKETIALHEIKIIFHLHHKQQLIAENFINLQLAEIISIERWVIGRQQTILNNFRQPCENHEFLQTTSQLVKFDRRSGECGEDRVCGRQYPNMQQQTTNRVKNVHRHLRGRKDKFSIYERKKILEQIPSHIFVTSSWVVSSISQGFNVMVYVM